MSIPIVIPTQAVAPERASPQEPELRSQQPSGMESPGKKNIDELKSARARETEKRAWYRRQRHGTAFGSKGFLEPDKGFLVPDLEAARERGQLRVAVILSGDEMLSADQFAAMLGMSRVTINTRRQNRLVLGLEGAKRGFRYPAWQIGEDGKPFAWLPQLFDRLGDSPWAVYRFLVQHHPELDGLTGIEALRRGNGAGAVKAAESTVQTFS